MIPYNNELKQHSRNLRRNMTKAERLLWVKIRRKQLNGFQFYRQRIIGNYIVDFYCPKAKLILEVDGGQHYADEIVMKKDSYREDYLKNNGIKVLRFSKIDVFKNLKGVIGKIYENL